MILERVTGYAQEDVDQPIVSDSGQHGLLVVKRVFGNDSGSSVGYLGERKVRVWQQRKVDNQCEAVFARAGRSDDPGFALRSFLQNAGRKADPVTETVDQISQVFRKINVQFVGE